MTLEDALTKWPELELISNNRLRAIGLMLKCDWSLDKVIKKSQKHYEFRRADTGGLYDVMTISHAELDPLAVTMRMVGYETDLADAVHSAAGQWITEKMGESSV